MEDDFEAFMDEVSRLTDENPPVSTAFYEGPEETQDIRMDLGDIVIELNKNKGE